MIREQWVICDIDGTISDMRGRIQFAPDWEKVHEDCENDPPFTSVMRLVDILSQHYNILMLTGRNERFRPQTIRWFDKQLFYSYDKLLMRPDFNFDHDVDLKWNEAVRFFENEEKLRASVFMIIEDRDACVEMWRNKGMFCIQPRIGDY
jgi:hypothetical protein